MGGIELIAGGIGEELRRRLLGQHTTQRENLALLVATMLEARSANVMELAAALPRAAERIAVRHQWIVRVLANPRIDCDAVMAPFAREALARAAEAGRVELILDQSKLSDCRQVLRPALRFGERALPLARRVEETAGAMGWSRQQPLLDLVAIRLPEGAAVVVLADRVYGTAELIAACAARPRRPDAALPDWGGINRRASPPTSAPSTTRATASHREAIRRRQGRQCRLRVAAMSDTPGYLTVLDYAHRWGIEPMFSDFKSRGFGLDDTQIRYLACPREATPPTTQTVARRPMLY